MSKYIYAKAFHDSATGDHAQAGQPYRGTDDLRIDELKRAGMIVETPSKGSNAGEKGAPSNKDAADNRKTK